MLVKVRSIIVLATMTCKMIELTQESSSWSVPLKAKLKKPVDDLWARRRACRELRLKGAEVIHNKIRPG